MSNINLINELPEEKDFKNQLDSELEKINNFYSCIIIILYKHRYYINIIINIL